MRKVGFHNDNGDSGNNLAHHGEHKPKDYSYNTHLVVVDAIYSLDRAMGHVAEV